MNLTRTIFVRLGAPLLLGAVTLMLAGMASSQSVSFSPTSLTFASQSVGTSSSPQNVILTNTGTVSLSIIKITLTGTNAKDYSQTNNCGKSVAAGANCTITVTFTPTKNGTRTANVSVADNASGSPQLVPLTGTGIAPAVSLIPSSLTFSSQLVGTTSAVQNVTLKNSGMATLTVSSISATGDFAQTNTCGSSVAAGASCSISVTFTPIATGTRTGSVSISDNATGSPQTVSVTGTGASGIAGGTLTVLGPAPRVRHSAVFDLATETMITFGGQNPNVTNFGDVWQLVFNNSLPNTVDWLPVSWTGSTPDARNGQTAVYDATNSLMIVFGGAEGLSSPAPCQNDSWVLQNANGVAGARSWVQLLPAGGPPTPRYLHTAVYDPTSDSMIVFGGSDCNAGYLNDVWILSNANGLGGSPVWTQLAPTGTPPAAREAASAIYDPGSNVMTVYGGDTGGSSVLGDVWTLSNANGIGGTPVWTQLFPTGTAPAARTGHTAVYDSANNRMIIYGGLAASGAVLGDTWVLVGANGLGAPPAWVSLAPTNPGTNKAYHSAVYDPSTNYMTVWAGNISVVPADDHVFILFDANGLP